MKNIFAYRIIMIAFCLFLGIAILGNTVAFAQTNCLSTGSPTTVMGSLAAGDLTMTQRPFRDGTNSTCLLNEVIGGNPIAGTFRYDATTFTAPGSSGNVCVKVTYNNAGCGTNQTFVTAYNGAFTPTAVHTNLVGSIGSSIVGLDGQVLSFSVPAGSQFNVVVSEVQTAGCPSYSYTVSYATSCKQPGFDSANDGTADRSFWNPTAPSTYSWKTTDVAAPTNVQYGLPTMTPVIGDWDGNGSTTLGAYSPAATAVWYTTTNPATNYGYKNWGTTGDIPVQGDYDGDNITDVAVFRPSNSTWFALRSSDSTLFLNNWGQTGDVPVPGDYDGDYKIDLAVYRTNDVPNANRETWYTLLSNRNYSAFTITTWGVPGDVRVPADYDGDGKTDIAVFRPSDGNWYIVRSGQPAATQLQVINWGLGGDIPQPADYDGDLRADTAVYRPSNTTWYLNRTTGGFLSDNFGSAGIIPTSSAYGVPR